MKTGRQKLVKVTDRRRATLLEALRILAIKEKFGKNAIKPARLLTIANFEEIKEALKKGNLIFYGLRKRFEIPLKTENGKLIMPFFSGGKIYIARFNYENNSIQIFELNGNREKDLQPCQFISCEAEDMGHLIMSKFEKRGVILPLLKIAAEHAVALKGKAKAQVFLKRFLELFLKVGYKIKEQKPLEGLGLVRILSAMDRIKLAGGDYEKTGIMHYLYTLEYERKPENDKRNNLENNYRVVAYDPRTGRQKSFYFKKNSEWNFQ